MNVTIKQTLLGPTVVGLVFGLFAGLAFFGFYLDYGPHTHPELQPVWRYALLHAAQAFAGMLVGVVAVFGAVPAIIRKTSSKLAQPDSALHATA